MSPKNDENCDKRYSAPRCALEISKWLVEFSEKKGWAVIQSFIGKKI